MKDLTTQTNNTYPDLTPFREPPHHRPYTTNKHKVRLYQAGFLLFGMVFLTLAGLIYFKTTNWTCALYFGNCMAVKMIVITLCLFFSFISISTSLNMRTEKEAINHLAKRAKYRLRRTYLRIKAQLGLTSLFSFNDQNAQYLKQIYLDTREIIADRQAETLHLFYRIKNSHEIDPEIKEDLYNQAILEFHDQLFSIVLSFRHSNPRPSNL